MIKTVSVSISLLFLTTLTSNAQQTAYFNLNRNYHAAMELLDKGKYVAAAEQFREVEKPRNKTSNQPVFESETSLLKENAFYYEALCALNLGNEDAESMFRRFIKEHPENPLAKVAYFQIGKSFFKQEKYQEALKWFDMVQAGELTGKENVEYKFDKGYAYFELKDYQNAQLIFSEIKDRKTPYSEDATYYFAYIAYLNKDYHLALLNFEKLKNSKKYEASYPYYISAVYYLDKRYDDVIAYAVPIINTTKQTNETEMLRIIAASYFAKVDYPNSIKYYERFQEADQNKTQNNQDSYQLGYAYFKTGNNPFAVRELEKLIDKTDIYSQNGNYTLGNVFLKVNNKQGARNAFQVASRLDFDRAVQEDALYQYAKLSYELQFNNQALEAIRLYIKNYPRSTKINDAKVLLGEILLSTSNYKEAVDILESIPNRNGAAKEAYQKVTYYRGLQFYNERAFENAIGIFLRSLKDPVDEQTEALATYWMAESMFEVRKYSESVENFEKFMDMPAARKTSVYNYANYALGYAAFGDEKYQKAANNFERFIQSGERDKNTVNDAVLRLGDSYFVLKNYSRANENYNRILSQHAQGEDYALFQRGMIQGLQNQLDTKISTLNGLLQKFPESDYADDASFEMAYSYFLKNNGDQARTDLTAMIRKYPQSSYVPRALVTIGLIDYNANQDEPALEAFKRVIKDYPASDEAKQSLKQIEKIYTDNGDAKTFIDYAATTPIGNYSSAQQDNLMFTAANNLYLRGDFAGTVNAMNAYFDKFPKPINDKQARFIRAESNVKLNHPEEATTDYNYILNDWTSIYTEKSLISMSNIYLKQKKYNEAVVFLKHLETNSEYKADYSFAINNLLLSYAEMQMPDESLKYAALVRSNEKSSEEDKYKSGLYAGKAYLLKSDTANATKEFNYVVSNTKTVAAAEAKYNVANLEYLRGNYKASIKTCLEFGKTLSAYDYWYTKSFILLADNYVALKDIFQAKSTLQSVIENYKGNDDILPTAKAKLDQLNNQNTKKD
ncbi:MAG: tetratricopeptide repeat protein [Janthinobacterium lividum]